MAGELDALLKVAAGAGGTGVVLGLWLWRTLKKLEKMEEKLDGKDAEIKALHAARLEDYKTLLPAIQASTAAIAGNEDELARLREVQEHPPNQREPTGRRKTT